MKACPFCRGRATKLLSLTTGLLTCQQCGRSYEVEGLKEAVDSAVKKAGEELERRFLYGENTSTPVGLLGRSPISGARACAAATPEECDYPHGCSACCAEEERRA